MTSLSGATRSWTIDGPRCRLHLRDWGGDGAAVLLLHGLGAHTHWWDSTAPRLAGLRPVALDLRGHGESGWAKGEEAYGLEGFADDVAAACESLGGAAAIAAHSLGARVALKYAARNPCGLLGVAAFDFLCEVRADVEDRFTRARSLPQPYYDAKEPIARRFRLHPAGTALSAGELGALGEHSIKQEPDGRWTWRFDWSAFRLRFEPVWPTLPGIRTPALFVRGEHSTVMPREHLERLGRELPDSETLEIPGAHHHVPLDAPAACAAAIRRFFIGDSLRPGAPSHRVIE